MNKCTQNFETKEGEIDKSEMPSQTTEHIGPKDYDDLYNKIETCLSRELADEVVR